jgi:hypothetical protein
MAPNEAEETCYILLKFANGEFGMGTPDSLRNPFYMLVCSQGGPKFKILHGMKMKLLLCKLIFLEYLLNLIIRGARLQFLGGKKINSLLSRFVFQIRQVPESGL